MDEIIMDSLDLIEVAEQIKECITNNIPSVLRTLITQNQKRQKAIIFDFQMRLVDALSTCIPEIVWEYEHRMNERLKDSIDIFGVSTSYVVIMELDKPRADQVAKKILSRIANYMDIPVLYVALCYPGTKSMNSNECRKYFSYGRNIMKRLNNNSMFMGCILDENLDIVFDY